MHKIDKKSLYLHKKYRGKLKIGSRIPLRNLTDLSLAYTPGVAEVCRQIHKYPKTASLYTMKGNSLAIITDGSAVLGLGNIGPLAALPVMEGKAILHKHFAGLDAFPICLDTQDPQKIIEAVKLIAPVFGAIHLEDIAAPNCFIIERELQKQLTIPVLHDDQHCTAVTVLAALINACSVPINGKPRLPISQRATAKIVINGAGAAGSGITRLLAEYGFKNLIILDSQGAIYKERPGLEGYKKELAQISNKKNIQGNLLQSLKNADVFIGVSKAGLLEPAMVKTMNPHPIIFALANPVPEIMPIHATKSGAFIVATGRSDFPNQINNVLTFPGIFRGVLDNQVQKITNKMLIRAAKNLAALVPHPSPKKILPDLFNKQVVKAVAKAIRN